MPDKVPMGAFVNKSLTMRAGQTHMHRYMKPLLDRVEKGEIDPSFMSPTIPLDRSRRCTRLSETRKTAASRSYSSRNRLAQKIKKHWGMISDWAPGRLHREGRSEG
jgi:hypothetical protein